MKSYQIATYLAKQAKEIRIQLAKLKSKRQVKS